MSQTDDADRVLLPQEPRSTKYHALDCRFIDRDRAAIVDRTDAEALGRRPSQNCLGGASDE